MWKEFKEFATKGNIVDLAIGVVIGGAFQKIVNSLVEDIIMPAVYILTGKVDFSDIENKESLDIINIAIIDNSDYQNDTIFKNTIESLSNKNTKNQIFNIFIWW